MGNRGKYRNVEARSGKKGGKIRITFKYKSERRRETIEKDPTPKNLKSAANLLAEIENKIANGRFKYAEYFPDSLYVKENLYERSYTLLEFCRMYMKSIDHLAPATIHSYKNWLNVFGAIYHMDIKEIRPMDIEMVLADKAYESMKTRNNVMTPLRQVFKKAVENKLIEESPCDAIKSAKVQKKIADPFEIPEVRVIFEWLNKYRHQQIANYFGFAFGSGLRPSEQIALCWNDIDFNKKTARINKNRVRGVTKNTTKTYTERNIELSDFAFGYLIKQKQYTYLEGNKVFHNPTTDRPWNNEEKQRLHWNSCLKALGIRHRVPYQCRHTYATTALMAGSKPAWISRQLGHKNIKMLLETYAKWIDQADGFVELNKLNEAFELTVNDLGQKLGQPGIK